jgi:hypothetical protein
MWGPVGIDDQSMDLVRALVDLGALGVAHQPLDPGLPRVTIRSEQLNGDRRRRGPEFQAKSPTRRPWARCDHSSAGSAGRFERGRARGTVVPPPKAPYRRGISGPRSRLRTSGMESRVARSTGLAENVGRDQLIARSSEPARTSAAEPSRRTASRRSAASRSRNVPHPDASTIADSRRGDGGQRCRPGRPPTGQRYGGVTFRSRAAACSRSAASSGVRSRWVSARSS